MSEQDFHPGLSESITYTLTTILQNFQESYVIQ